MNSELVKKALEKVINPAVLVNMISRRPTTNGKN